MATRKFLMINAAVANADAVIPTFDGAQNLIPPNGIKWTIVEVRWALKAAGRHFAKFDSEKYWEGRQENDFLAKGKADIVTIDIVRPHFMEFHAEADAAGPTTALDEVFVEESPLTGG